MPMNTGPLTREQIVSTFRMLLDREPESEETVEYHLVNSRSLTEFREKVLTGPEFQSKYSALVQKNDGNPEYRAKLVGFDDRETEGLAFLELFEQVLAPRLDRRADTFRTTYRHLLAHRPQNITVLETGCLRSAGNWAGDGQSTLQFEYLVRRCGGHVVSVDYSPLSVAVAHYLCPAVHFVLSDSVSYLRFLSDQAPCLRVDLLYLDSMDIDLDHPLRSAEHHLRELSAAWPLLRPGSLVLIDDHDCPTDAGRVSKSTLANEWLERHGAAKIAEGYQIVWEIR